jgi:hypothetical protein
MIIPPAFDPISLAVAASAVEHVCARAQPQRRIAPRAKIWLRKHSQPVVGALLQESADPALDALNHISPKLGAVLALLLVLRCLIYIKFDLLTHTRAPAWRCIAAVVHVLAAVCEPVA